MVVRKHYKFAFTTPNQMSVIFCNDIDSNSGVEIGDREHFEIRQKP
jgi:hypothetical protein